MNISTIALLLLTPLLVWRVYDRLKKMMGRQRSLLARHTAGLVVFSAVILIVTTGLLPTPELLAWLALGVAIGIGYGVWGLRLTRYENTSKGLFFTPNRRLGILVPMLMVARLLYIGFEKYAEEISVKAMVELTHNPITIIPLGLMAGYFASYSAGLLLWRRKQRIQTEAEPF